MTVRVRATVEALPPYRGLPGGRPPVRLDGNENPLGPSPLVRQALAEVGEDALARYPATDTLRRRWARWLRVRPGNLLLTSGSGPAIALTAELVLEPGDPAVVLAPSFELYGLAVRRRGATVRTVAVRAGRRFPIRGVRKALAGARYCVLGLPDNPTGVGPTVRQVAELARAFPDTFFVIDEAYLEFTGRTARSVALRRSNVVVLRTLSKAWGLAGLRVGAVVGRAPVIERLGRLNVPYPVTALAAAGAEAALSDPGHVRRTVALVRRERPRLVRALTRAGLPTRATDANFVLADAGSAARAGAMVRALATLGVAVRDRSHLPGLEGVVRVSIGTSDEHARLLEALRLLLAPAPDALLLDMDGTLVDVTRSYDEIIWRMVQDRAGSRARSRETVLAIKNDPRANDDVDAIMLALAQRRVPAERAEVEREFVRRYRGRDGMHRLERWMVSPADLQQLAAALPLAVVTGRPRVDLALAFRRQPVRRLFSAVVTADDTSRHKPDPAPVRRARRLLGVRRPWMVGDSPADLLAARAAGVPAIGIATGRRAAMLRTFNPLAVLESAAQLVPVLHGRALLAAASENP